MRTAQFDSTGSKVNVVFDQAVLVRDSERTRLVAVDCSSLFADAVRLLGAGAVCKLPSSKTLQIILSSGAGLLPSVSAKEQTDVFSPADAQKNCASNMLSLLQNSVKSSIDESVGGLGCVRVAAPSNPQPPIAVPVYQRRIGVCDDVTVHAASSVAASGGRPLTFAWNVAFFNGTEEIHLPDNSPALGDAASATIRKNAMPDAATVIRVTLKLRSIFKMVTTTVIEVKRVLDQLPSVELNAQTSVLKRNSFIMSASGSIPPCANDTKATARPSFAYSWQMWSIPTQSGKSRNSQSSVELVVPLDVYTNRRQSALRFVPHALASCTTYRLRCTVAYSTGDGSSVSNWQTHDVAVSQGNIVAIISGQ